MAPTDQDSDSGDSTEEESSRNRPPPEAILIQKQARKKKTLERPVTGKHHTQYISKKGKKKQQQAEKRKRQESDSDSDHSPARKKPVSSRSHRESQRRQRVDNHPNTEMVKTRNGKRSGDTESGSSGSAKKKAKKTKGNPKDDESYANVTEASSLASGNTTELAERKIYQKKIDAMQKELTEYLSRKKNGGKGKKKKLTDMEKLVFQTAKHQLFKKIKFSWQGQLKNHTRWVMNYIQPKELQDLPQEFKVKGQDIWIERYEDFVRQGLNDKHNDIKQEMKKVYVPPDAKVGDDFNPHGLPISANLIEDLVMEATGGQSHPQGTYPQAHRWDSEARNCNRYANQLYLVPQIATDKAWGKAHRYQHGNPLLTAEMEPHRKGANPMPSVSPSDLAYLAAYYHNYQPQLEWHKKRLAGELAKFPNNHANEDARGKDHYTKSSKTGKSEETAWCEPPPGPTVRDPQARCNCREARCMNHEAQIAFCCPSASCPRAVAWHLEAG